MIADRCFRSYIALRGDDRVGSNRNIWKQSARPGMEPRETSSRPGNLLCQLTPRLRVADSDVTGKVRQLISPVIEEDYWSPTKTKAIATAKVIDICHDLAERPWSKPVDKILSTCKRMSGSAI